MGDLSHSFPKIDFKFLFFSYLWVSLDKFIFFSFLQVSLDIDFVHGSLMLACKAIGEMRKAMKMRNPRMLHAMPLPFLSPLVPSVSLFCLSFNVIANYQCLLKSKFPSSCFPLSSPHSASTLKQLLRLYMYGDFSCFQVGIP